jgi:DNA-binding NarL/FixJ family response regulator
MLSFVKGGANPTPHRPSTIVIRINLTDVEARRLEQAFLQATDRKLRDRLQIIRLAHRGRPHRDIAADLGITTRTVQN